MDYPTKPLSPTRDTLGALKAYSRMSLTLRLWDASFIKLIGIRQIAFHNNINHEKSREMILQNL